MFTSALRWHRKLKYGVLVAIALIGGIVLSQLLQWRPVSQVVSLPLAGGDTTVNNRSSRAFSNPAPGLSPEELERHLEGDANFDAVFVTAPALVNPGLGPRFNNASCNGCHLKDGRGMPQPGQSLVRVSLAKGKPEVPGGAVPLPGIGSQVRDQAIFGDTPDAKVSLTWQEKTGQYPDGSPYRLRSPQITLAQVDAHQPIPPETLISLRVPPPVFGAGLLEAVPDADLLTLADPGDRNHDGISGKPNLVWDVQHQRKALGRFGLKANTPNLLVQTAAAYVNDIGVTNPLFPDTASFPEIDQRTLEMTTFYVQTLGVPARTLVNDSQAQWGEKLFIQTNCTACHIATLKTADSKIPVLANQTFHAYTDLLLHDMGEALSDHRPDFEASGSEWRTSPLWGLGLAQTVLPYSGYLHDGRARTIEEAILWHGGEAQRSKEQFMALSRGDRENLLRFLTSL